MDPSGNAHSRVELRFEGIDELPVRLPEHGLEIVGLGRSRNLRIGGESIECLEIFAVLPGHPVGLRLAENGRSIVPVNVQGGIVAGQCRRVIIHPHGIVAQDCKHLRGRIFPAVFIQHPERLLALVLTAENIEFCHHSPVIAAELGLNLLDGLKGLSKVILADVDLRKAVVEIRLLRKILHQLLVHVDGKFRPSGHSVKSGKHIPVPEIPLVQGNRLLQVGLGSRGILKLDSRHSAVIPGGVVLRGSGKDASEQGLGLPETALIVERYRINQLIVIYIPAVLGKCGADRMKH